MEDFEHDIARFTYANREVRFRVGDAGVASEDYIRRIHRSGRFYEQRALEKLADLVPWGGVVCDVGANVGNHSVFLSLFTPARQVIPFEANPLMVEVLRANVALNAATSIDLSYVGCAIGEAEGTAWLRVDDLRNWGSGHLDFRAEPEGAAFQVQVPIRPLDAFALTEVHLLKIDVEGHEMAVLRGAAETLARCKPCLFLELTPSNRGRVAAMLDQLGYRPTDCFQDHRGVMNVLFVNFA